MAYDQAVGAASLYRIDLDGSVEVVLDQVTVSNDWSGVPTDTTRGENIDTRWTRWPGLSSAPTSGSKPSGSPLRRLRATQPATADPPCPGGHPAEWGSRSRYAFHPGRPDQPERLE
jgi:hypothetical protein